MFALGVASFQRISCWHRHSAVFDSKLHRWSTTFCIGGLTHLQKNQNPNQGGSNDNCLEECYLAPIQELSTWRLDQIWRGPKSSYSPPSHAIPHRPSRHASLRSYNYKDDMCQGNWNHNWVGQPQRIGRSFTEKGGAWGVTFDDHNRSINMRYK